MRSCTRPLLAALIGVTLVLLAACDDSALNEFGADGALQTTLTIELHDGWIDSPEATDGGAPGALLQLPVHPHNDITFQVTNMGTEPHGFALYADAEGTELLARSTSLESGALQLVTFHFHDPQTAYFFDDQHRDEMRGELHVVE